MVLAGWNEQKAIKDFQGEVKKGGRKRKMPLVVAVSGGPDSMALCYLLDRWVAGQRGKGFCPFSKVVCCYCCCYCYWLLVVVVLF